MCRERESNPHGLEGQQFLRLHCLPFQHPGNIQIIPEQPTLLVLELDKCPPIVVHLACMARPPSSKKTLTNAILLVLEKSVDGYMRFEDFISNPGFYAYYGWEYPLKKSDFARAFKRLRERGLVELLSDKELIFRLTDQGRDKALWQKIKESRDKWDGKWRLVVWDIPEKRRVARDLLRFKLKQLGFTQWQKSVWASKINCTEVLRNFIKQVGIEDWVMIIESDNIGI
ncbi:MAG: Repressor in ring oxydation complex/ phenylacetic acid degradation pathway related protein (PaaX) [Candidatus Daviesbacteria bacterium GW2011_GWA2_42_7]|uniref:Repressor in ring oxydation complex/ phenylacetic acid degradation pathway related protein (PaaX) n=2 Tax=Candidatus Daviesiibacteriota TaxID=1752718 RepID=A0A0G1ATW7_9BACT|nr:MAG: Repressor in ring oxydation complex/ phenylacetic acid degradation pathway related protein (PaaX) [Candidatus Daviesbacteria bacterium GW2011_GWA1_42_6]KKS70403.1 MAG: Repressor in ring oxydation complex/ phenylacetic acid degradation pathway related protein (PaaX) [Candidatus Daviesbacteria bacterium GW2011_GWA2_42_7]